MRSEFYESFQKNFFFFFFFMYQNFYLILKQFKNTPHHFFLKIFYRFIYRCLTEKSKYYKNINRLSHFYLSNQYLSLQFDIPQQTSFCSIQYLNIVKIRNVLLLILRFSQCMMQPDAIVNLQQGEIIFFHARKDKKKQL